MMRNITGLDISCLPDSQPIEVPNAVFIATSKECASPSGIIVYCHGVAASPWDQFKLAEELASEGYVVAAPEFANAATNNP